MEQAVQWAMRSQADRMQIKQIISGTATNVGETTCDVEREGAPVIYDVRLNAIDDNLESFVTIYPQTGSFVLVGIVENMNTEAVVLRCSEVEKVKVKIGEQRFIVDKDGFVFNEGNNKGLLKLDAVISWMGKVYADLQTLKTQLSTWTVTGNGAPLGLVFNPTTPNASANAFEDTNIKH
ncbi:MAG: hypothetical protein LBN93_06685 [Candidatus Symbiothrix sp.]|nr:hypothetical protein [Candidatus Symbiothrix sp.]